MCFALIPITGLEMFVWKFAFCLFTSNAYKCTWIGRHLKETVLWSKAECKRTQHCWILHVASVCTPCCMLLDVVACCCAKFEIGQTFQTTTPDISFVSWSPKRSATIVYKDLWVVSFPKCTAGPNIVGSCCIPLQTTGNRRATTPNIVGSTMLGLVGQQ